MSRPPRESEEEKEAKIKALAQAMSTPDGYAEVRLGMKLYKQQRLALQKLGPVGSRVSLASANSGGKALALDTPIPTPDGWKTMGELSVGDRVFGSDGVPCFVTFATAIMNGRPCNKVIFSDGSELIADDDHLWKTLKMEPVKGSRKSLHGMNKSWIGTTRQVKDTLFYGNDKWGGAAHKIPLCPPIQYPERGLLIPPYTFGAWLGDGDSKDAVITFSEKDRAIIERIKLDGLKTSSEKKDPRSNAVRIRITWEYHKKNNSFISATKDLGVFKDKHIPRVYLESSVEQRTNLLMGLMDTDGYSDERGKCEFVTCKKKLADNFLELVLGLGFKASLKTSEAKLYGRVVGLKHRISFKGTSDRRIFHLERKQRLLKSKTPIASHRYIVAIDKCESVPVKCIQVDSADHCYIAGKHFIITHNTRIVAAAAILWHMEMFPKGIVDITSGSYRQIEDQLMPAIKAHAHLYPRWKFFSDPYIETHMKGAPNVRGGFLRGFATDEPGRAEGDHEYGADEPLLYIVDEAKSVPPWLQLVVEGRVRPTRLLLISSHGFAEGWFYESQTTNRHLYSCVNQSADDCPHITKKEIQEVRDKWPGPFGDSILGYGFIPLVEDAIFHYRDVDWCMMRNCLTTKFGDVHAFCDFAWSNDGDESVLAMRNGNHARLEACFRSDELHKLCDRFVAEFKRLGLEGHQISGDNGGGGKLVMDELDRRGWRLNRVDNNAKPNDDERYANMGTEIWYEGGKLITNHAVAIDEDRDLRFQLLNRKRVKDPKGKLRMESKRDMKKRGVMSPDRADALLACLGPRGGVGFHRSGGGRTMAAASIGGYKPIGG